jgi:hypothetical protein
VVNDLDAIKERRQLKFKMQVAPLFIHGCNRSDSVKAGGSCNCGFGRRCSFNNAELAVLSSA